MLSLRVFLLSLVTRFVVTFLQVNVKAIPILGYYFTGKCNLIFRILLAFLATRFWVTILQVSVMLFLRFFSVACNSILGYYFTGKCTRSAFPVPLMSSMG